MLKQARTTDSGPESLRVNQFSVPPRMANQQCLCQQGRPSTQRRRPLAPRGVPGGAGGARPGASQRRVRRHTDRCKRPDDWARSASGGPCIPPGRDHGTGVSVGRRATDCLAPIQRPGQSVALSARAWARHRPAPWRSSLGSPAALEKPPAYARDRDLDRDRDRDQHRNRSEVAGEVAPHPIDPDPESDPEVDRHVVGLTRRPRRGGRGSEHGGLGWDRAPALPTLPLSPVSTQGLV